MIKLIDNERCNIIVREGIVVNKDFLNIQQKLINSRLKGNHIPLMLVILDGWGIAPDWGGNAISLAKTPIYDELCRKFPKTEISASGERVGLPDDAPGNSEAGHLNIGAGRVVHQDIAVVDRQITQGQLKNSASLMSAIKQVKQYKSSVHIMGLLSEAGTHSHIKHLVPILNYLKENGTKNVYLHLFSDGRDSDPMSGIVLADKVEQITKKVGLGTITSVIGRFYAMDRDNRWGRTARAYNVLVKCEGENAESVGSIFSQSYARRITDEFIEPRIVVNKHQSCVPIGDNDVLISFNFRSDRIKQLITAFLNPSLPQFPDRKLLKNLKVLSFTIYQADEDLSEHIFTPEKVEVPIASIISQNGLRQLHCAETEKFPHITYFINGGREKPFELESRLLIPSPKVNTYDLCPEMSAEKVTGSLIKILNKNYYDFYIVNYANPDMVGHSGNLGATMIAVSYVDKCLGQIAKKIFEKDGVLIICADHGNAEQMVNTRTGDPDTEHTTNPVPFIIANKELKNSIKLESNGSLANIAPTILDICGISSAGTSYIPSLIIKS